MHNYNPIQHYNPIQYYKRWRKVPSQRFFTKTTVGIYIHSVAIDCLRFATTLNFPIEISNHCDRNLATDLIQSFNLPPFCDKNFATNLQQPFCHYITNTFMPPHFSLVFLHRTATTKEIICVILNKNDHYENLFFLTQA